LLAFCWALEESGSDQAVEVARAEFGASGLSAVRSALDGLSGAVIDRQAFTIPADVPGFLKDDLEDLSRFLARRPEGAKAAHGDSGVG
jgi:molybdopterin-guanine dinucleotide biosynthesis protein A